MADYTEFGGLLGGHLYGKERPSAWLATKLGVSEATVSRWLNNITNRPGTAETVIRIAGYLDLNQEQCEALLKAAGYTTSLVEHRDILAKKTTATAGDAVGFIDTMTAQQPQRFGDGTDAFLFRAPSGLEHALVGREPLLQTLKQRLFSGENIALTGLPGAGKTALAVTLAHDTKVQEHFRDGVLWAKLGVGADNTAIAAQLHRWARALSISTETFSHSFDELMDAIQDAIGLRHMLLVVDDAWSAEAALNFKLGGPNSAHLLTTRQSKIALDFSIHGKIDVAELSMEDSLTLLTNLAPIVAETEPDAVHDLLETVGGLPLAVVLMGSYLNKEAESGQPRRMQVALEKLRMAEERLAHAEVQQTRDYHPSLVGRTRVSLEAVIAVSDESLPAPARRAFYALSLFPPKPNSFSERAALAVAQEPPAQTFDTLVDSRLLESGGAGRFMLHQVIADYARKQLTDEDARTHLISYFADYTEQHPEDYDRTMLEYDNVLMALTLARKSNNPGRIPLLMALSHMEGKRGNYDQLDQYAEEGLVLARALGEPERICRMLLKLNATAVIRGLYDKADIYAQEGLALARQAGEHEIEARLLDNVGVAIASQGYTYDDRKKLEQARVHWQEGLALSRRMQYRERICNFAGNLGALEIELGEYEQAHQHLQEALREAQHLDDPWLMNGALLYQGELHLRQQQIEQAAEQFEAALALSQEKGFEELIAESLYGQARVADALGNREEARVLGKESLRRYQAIHHSSADRVENWLSSR